MLFCFFFQLISIKYNQLWILENCLEKKANQNHQKVLMITKSKNNKKTNQYIFLLFYRSETNIQNSTQTREKAPIRESIHSETILNVYPVDASTLLTASQDRV